MLIKDFFDRTASQISYEGLLALHETVRERQLAVFFRNSHFNTMLKYEGKLYLLCTDIAFATSHLCWERFDEVDGDTEYVDADFQVTPEGGISAEDAAAIAAVEAAEVAAVSGGPPPGDADAQLAWQMMQEDLRAEQERPTRKLPRPKLLHRGPKLLHRARPKLPQRLLQRQLKLQAPKQPLRQ